MQKARFPLEEVIEEDDKISWIYGMRLRGYSIGTQPTRGLVEVGEGQTVSGYKYHSLLAYNRQLTEKEVSSYDLDYLGTFNHNKNILEEE